MPRNFSSITFDHRPSSWPITWLPLFIHAEPTPPTTISPTEDLSTTTTISPSSDPHSTTILPPDTSDPSTLIKSDSKASTTQSTGKPSLDKSKGTYVR